MDGYLFMQSIQALQSDLCKAIAMSSVDRLYMHIARGFSGLVEGRLLHHPLCFGGALLYCNGAIAGLFVCFRLPCIGYEVQHSGAQKLASSVDAQ